MMRMIFTAVLRLYPERIQREFTAEMVDVFEQASANVRQKGTAAYCAFIVRELSGLIVNLVVEGAHVTHKRGIVYGALAGLLISGAFSWGWMARPYTATAMFRVRPSQLPDRLVPAQLHGDLPREVLDARQLMISRVRLADLIAAEKLYAHDLSGKPLEDVVEEMGEAIQITAANENEIRISFTYSDRIAAQRVVSKLIDALCISYPMCSGQDSGNETRGRVSPGHSKQGWNGLGTSCRKISGKSESWRTDGSRCSRCRDCTTEVHRA